MMRVGTKSEAMRALRGELARLGSGGYRSAFINETRTVVYKICHDWEDEANTSEYEHIVGARAAKIPYIPPASLYVLDSGEPHPVESTKPLMRHIIAMPFYERRFDELFSYAELDKRTKVIEDNPDWRHLCLDAGGGNTRLTKNNQLRITDVQAI